MWVSITSTIFSACSWFSSASMVSILMRGLLFTVKSHSDERKSSASLLDMMCSGIYNSVFHFIYQLYWVLIQKYRQYNFHPDKWTKKIASIYKNLYNMASFHIRSSQPIEILTFIICQMVSTNGCTRRKLHSISPVGLVSSEIEDTTPSWHEYNLSAKLLLPMHRWPSYPSVHI